MKNLSLKAVLAVVIMAAAIAGFVAAKSVMQPDAARRFNVYVSGAQPFTVEATSIVSEANCTVYRAKYDNRICVAHVAIEVVPGAPSAAQPQPKAAATPAPQQDVK